MCIRDSDQVEEYSDEGEHDDEDDPDGFHPALQVMTAEDVDEDGDHQPDLDEEQKEPQDLSLIHI